MTRRRLDQELVRRGLAVSRVQAQELVAASKVLVSGAIADKPTRLVSPADPVILTVEKSRFVSRGGDKLQAAIDAFKIVVTGSRVIDAGASTGGFTDCALQSGAAIVVAVDVGHGQLHERIRRDERVKVWERTNVRNICADEIGGPADLVVADLSFISLRTVLSNLADFLEQQGDLVMLVKPQFEASRKEADRGRGVIRDPKVWQRVLHEVATAVDAAGLAVIGLIHSPLLGGNGNSEFLMHARKSESSTYSDIDVDTLITQIILEVAP
jgi:23S rRNA (cytidine1920-2'-O)/16S rRNA (cytidine1409-2'-O)-methyltransferase|tara:strand:- start:3756 stop:4562 length:807 start_codon:yes stop_codon:yes gene_type:complete